MVITVTDQARTTPTRPSWARRIGYLSAVAALGFAASWWVDERAYSRMEQTAVRTEARIVNITKMRPHPGRKEIHVVHYEITVGSTRRRFSDEHGTSKLREFHVGSWNGFEGPDPRVAAGKTIAVLVNPADIDDHRADRAHVPHPWMISLDMLLTVVLLAGLSTAAFAKSRR
jgi:hypothetical protein